MSLYHICNFFVIFIAPLHTFYFVLAVVNRKIGNKEYDSKIVKFSDKASFDPGGECAELWLRFPKYLLPKISLHS